MIRDLPSSTKVEGITIIAINKAELKGKKAHVTWGEQVNVTQPCSRFYQIQEEIGRVINHLGDFIDSDFYTVWFFPLHHREQDRVLLKNFIKKNISKS